MHINSLELLAIKFGIKSFLPLFKNIEHIRIMCDNTTAISYINKQGGTQNMGLNKLAGEIWEICIKQNVHLSAAHIPGAHNTLADAASREFIDSAEWMLDPITFGEITSQFGCPDVDMFASRLNKQLKNYISWKPDPESYAIDAMTVSWSSLFV